MTTPQASTTPTPEADPPHSRVAQTKRPPPHPAFRFSVRRLGQTLRQRMTGTSWHAGCPVGLDELRLVSVRHWSVSGHVRTGRIIVNRDTTGALRHVFSTLFRARFPIRRMRPVDAYGGDDYTSIEADNTSAFNCRAATGSTRWSQHAYGRAIDVNPIENPYVYADGTTTHAASTPYLDRSIRRPGMALRGRTLVAAFDAVGWGWGGRWPLPTDFQHFSATGR